MKKIILVSLTLLAASFTYAQLGFGIKAGWTMSKLSTDIEDYTEAAKSGFQLGGFIRIGDKLHLQPEAYFTTKSSALKFDLTHVDPNDPQNTVTSSVEQNVKLNSIDVPVLVGFRVLKLASLDVHVQAGPIASIVVSKNFDISFDGVDVDDEDSPIIEDDFSNVNWGLQFGAGVDFLFLTADIRYELGLNNIYNAPETMTTDPTIKNNVFFVSVGWKIH
jgi:hypothetical protein